MLTINLPSRPRLGGYYAHRVPSGLRQPTLMDLKQMQSGGSGASSRVVMVRKTDQRTFKTGEEPMFETVTRETVQTFHGNRSERITTSEKRDTFEDFPSQLRSSLNSSTHFPDSSLTTSTTTDSSKKPASKLKPRSPSSSPDSKKKSTKAKSSDSAAEGDFTTECLKAHNEYRQLHGVPTLKLNKKMCKFSEEWAKRLASRGIMEHRQGSEYGENIFCVWNSNPNYKVTGREPVDNWYNEIKDHVYGKEPSDLKTGHFTQVVWKESKELGVAFAKSARTGHIFVVANYSPPGNYIGNFAENVPPPGGFANDKKPKPSAAVKLKPKVGSDDSSDSSDDGNDFEKEGLKLHNDYRKKHGVPAMKLNPVLTRYAQDWANILARDNKFNHRQDGKYGENLFCSWSSDPNFVVSAKDACKSWYAEIKDFTFGSEPRSMKAGHFTQMIWKGSTELGIAMARSNGRVVIVANYNPRGNYIGQFAANCPRPR